MVAVETESLRSRTVEDAVEAIQADIRTAVADDATAVAVLERLGLARFDAIDQVLISYGPMRNPADEFLQRCRELVPTAWSQHHPKMASVLSDA